MIGGDGINDESNKTAPAPTRNTDLTKYSRAAGFDPAMQACGEILRSNRDMGLHADSLTPIALRMRDGEWEYPGGIEEPDLSGYDRFITGTDDGGEER